MQGFKIDPSTYVTDIVTNDYRASAVFRKYDIDFCFGNKWSLDMACKSTELDTKKMITELSNVVRQPPSSDTMDFNEWDIEFLSDYILNVHHRYLNKALPALKGQVIDFLEEHGKTFPGLTELEIIINRFLQEFPPHMKQEEEIIFPYIRQINHAFIYRESYASLMVRTLRKPVEEVMEKEHISTGNQLKRMRIITNNYTPPENSSQAHKALFEKLKDLDNDLMQHIHLENNILFPKAIAMEKQLLIQE
jgi:regulator of cell morphogenesis and NO signaling